MYVVEIVNIIISKNRIFGFSVFFFGFSVFFGFLNIDVGFGFGYRLGSTIYIGLLMHLPLNKLG